MSTSGKKAIRKSERQRKRNAPQCTVGRWQREEKKEWINTQGSGLAAIFEKKRQDIFCTPSEKI
jgi:hypothetical protein